MVFVYSTPVMSSVILHVSSVHFVSNVIVIDRGMKRQMPLMIFLSTWMSHHHADGWNVQEYGLVNSFHMDLSIFMLQPCIQLC